MKTFMLLGLAMASMFTAAYAQPCDGLPPIGTIYNCVVLSNGTKVLVTDISEVAGSTIYATFRVTGYTDNPCSVVLQDVAFSSQSQSISLGDFNTYTKPFEKPSQATITQNREGKSLFPATLDIELNLFATAKAIDGELEGDKPLQLINPELLSLPLDDVRVEQKEPVVFSDKNGKPRVELRDTKVELKSDGDKPPCEGLPPIGSVYHCYADGSKVLLVDGGSEPTSSQVIGVFEVVGYTLNPCGAIFANKEFSSQSKSDKLGEVTTYTKPDETTSLATLTQNKRGEKSLFPATLSIQLNLYAKATALDEEFRADRPLVLENTNVNSLPLKDVRVQQGEENEIKFTTPSGKTIGLRGTAVTIFSKD
jgi:hypothetical protein